MKKIILSLVLSVIVLLSTLCLLTACHSAEVHYPDDYIRTEKVQRQLSNGISGTYHGRSAVRLEKPDGTTNLVINDSVEYSVGGYSNPYVMIPHFPISLLSRVVNDKELSEVLARQQDIPVVMEYVITANNDDSETHEASIEVMPVPIALNLSYGGQEHVVSVNLGNYVRICVDADDASTWSYHHVVLEVEDITVDGKTALQFDSWGNPTTYFQIQLMGER